MYARKKEDVKTPRTKPEERASDTSLTSSPFGQRMGHCARIEGKAMPNCETFLSQKSVCKTGVELATHEFHHVIVRVAAESLVRIGLPLHREALCLADRGLVPGEVVADHAVFALIVRALGTFLGAVLED